MPIYFSYFSNVYILSTPFDWLGCGLHGRLGNDVCPISCFTSQGLKALAVSHKKSFML